ncbi:MAG: hypothetical protein VR72_10905 [Clostridiaceae bacterium BRH_c20a]|nr:MAG: hypothetical protein VR72_10905 [Clostridiaceae bacterium BRH_c20a]
MEAILKATLEVPVWCSFRIPTAVNVHTTYPVPPITTIFGLLSAAMGWSSDDHSNMDKLDIGILLIKPGERIEGYNKIIKWDRRDKQMRTLVMRHKLIQPVYQIAVKGEQGLIEHIAKALDNPYFPLCLGESDDVVEVKEVEVFPIKKTMTQEIDSILPQELGRPVNKVELFYLPIGFLAEERGNRRTWSGVKYQGYYIASKMQLEEPIEAYLLGEKRVVL